MSRNQNKNISRRPSLFSSKPGARNDQFGDRDVALKELFAQTNIASTASFRYDSPGNGIKSTQQLNVDWSKFENHCFFDSAQSKTNVAFDTIINDFPFDGTKKEVESFFDGLTGYENHIFQRFPKYQGYLIFSGTQKGEVSTPGLGTHVKVFDSRGFLFPGFSRNRDGESSIEFLVSPFTAEFFINIPDQENDNQIILQKRSVEKSSITLALSQSSSTDNCKIIFTITSGSSRLFTSASIGKGSFKHVAAVYDRGKENKASLYVNAVKVSSSSNSILFNTLDTDRAPLFIGSGSAVSVSAKMMPGGQSTFSPQQTLSGSVDELRIFHIDKSKKEIEDNKDFSIYNDENNSLKLYFKFNEASGSYKSNNVLLDSSGNSLHSVVTNYSISQRLTGSVKQPVKNEKLSLSPVIFPDNYLVKKLNTSILESAERFDSTNPNIITRLVPPHLFLEGQRDSGFSKLQGELYSPVKGTSIPGSAEIGSAQILTGFLLTYAKFFDELKLVLDSISNFLNVDYESPDTVPDQFIPLVAKYYGIQLPNLFSNSTIFEFIDGENIGEKKGYSARSLRDLQNELWKRFLINLPYIIKSKGTVHSVKSTIRSFGIDPDRLMTVREFGGPTRRSISKSRNRHVEPLLFLVFSGSKNSLPGTMESTGFFSKIPHLISPYLSSSRVEPGYPALQGAFVNKKDGQRNGISDNIDDGLLTSGSFSYEAFYRFLEPGRAGFGHTSKQSLARFSVTGSSISKNAPIINLVASSGSADVDPKVSLFVRSSLSTSARGLKVEIEGPNMFDGEPWYVSFGRSRSDDTITSVSQSFLAPKVSNVGSSSYFLSCARTSNGKIVESYFTSSLLKDEGNNSAFENISSTHNVSGTFFIIGSQSLGVYSNLFLSDTSLESATGFESGDRSLAMTTDFTGDVSKIRFWSKGLDKDQRKEHALNPRSYGSRDPRVEYNFASMNTGSFGRVRVDAQMDQPVTSSDSLGSILITNFTQEVGDISARSFESSKKVIDSEIFYISKFSPKFDLSQTDNKIRVRSYESFKNFAESLYAQPAPEHTVRQSERPDDDNRFAIEFSSVKALEDDIMSMFSDLVFFDNALGKPDLLFDEIYPDLEQARKVYFRRLFSKPEFQNYFMMFKWFNRSLGDIIEQLVPRNTRFLGVDFVYESHPLERSRFRYLFDEIYLKSNERSFDRGDILLSQFVGNICKF
jgi:hypothetical protein